MLHKDVNLVVVEGGEVQHNKKLGISWNCLLLFALVNNLFPSLPIFRPQISEKVQEADAAPN